MLFRSDASGYAVAESSASKAPRCVGNFGARPVASRASVPLRFGLRVAHKAGPPALRHGAEPSAVAHEVLPLGEAGQPEDHVVGAALVW